MMQATLDTIVYEKRGAVAWLTLNRPHRINAFDTQMRDDLWEALYAVDRDPEVGAVVIAGAGDRGFCSGADLSEFGTAPSQVIARAVRRERDVFERLYGLSKPTVAAVHGHVIGSGVEIALLCDLRIAAADSVFSMPETSLGLLPAAGGTQSLARAVRPGRALEIMLAGERLDAARALRIGLVERVVPRARLAFGASSVARRLASLPATGLAFAREAVRGAWRLPLSEGLAVESRIAARLCQASRTRT
jgi:enoyl-CoA hydratase/carnithine racemase